MCVQLESRLCSRSDSCLHICEYLLQRECSLVMSRSIVRNTPWILGVAVYVGDDTKTRLNASTSRMKFSNMQVNLNNCVRGLLVALCVLSIYATIVSVVGEGGIAADSDELMPAARNPIIRFFMFCITFYHVVPLSLYVMYEMLKLLLAYQASPHLSTIVCVSAVGGHKPSERLDPPPSRRRIPEQTRAGGHLGPLCPRW